jgi:prepilin-type N-terminal cleavage/methylation domain-containing protein
MKIKTAFTLIELLVVLAIMGFIISISMMWWQRAREQANFNKAQEDLSQIRTAIILARHKENKVLGQITGNWCSDCACRKLEDLGALPDDHQCIINMKNAFNKIGLPLLRDPWGSPYLIDENELEFSCDPCRPDLLRSAGPDRKVGQYNDDGETDQYCIKCPFCDWTWPGPEEENKDNIFILQPLYSCK